MASAIGIDIGGTKMRAARVSTEGLIETRQAIATPESASDVVATLDALIKAIDSPHVSTIGIGVPGRVDSNTGRILSGGHVDLSAFSFSDCLNNSKGRIVFTDNDANMALIAETTLGAARGLGSVVLLTIGTGIGGALMAGGKIIHGKATAGQLGHITVNIDGEPCLCGRNGCLETTSSGSALRKLMRRYGFKETDSLNDLLKRRDAAARSVLWNWARPLRFGIDSLVAAFDPERVVLGGGLGAAAVEALAEFPAVSPWYQCDVIAASCGDDAGVIGAAIASLRLHR